MPEHEGGTVKHLVMMFALALCLAACGGEPEDPPEPGPPVNGASCDALWSEGAGRYLASASCETLGESALCLTPDARWVEDSRTGACVLDGNVGAPECEPGGSPSCPFLTEVTCMLVTPDACR